MAGYLGDTQDSKGTASVFGFGLKNIAIEYRSATGGVTRCGVAKNRPFDQRFKNSPVLIIIPFFTGVAGIQLPS